MTTSRRIAGALLGLTLSATLLAAGAPADTHAVIPLWPGLAPGSERWTQQEVDTTFTGHAIARNVVRPTLTMYAPPAGSANGTAVIVCPGGGYLYLTMDSEGSDVAQWLAARGVTAFVLKYRVSNTGASNFAFKLANLKFFISLGWHALFGHKNQLPPSERIARIRPLAAADGLQAVRVVREHAAAWGIDPQKIGMIGFSAGGGVVDDVALSYDAQSRPDFVASIYGIGIDGRTVPQDAPPLFLAAAKDDPIVPPAVSVAMDARWRQSGHSSELHLYDNGGHGFGMRKQQKASDRWIDDYAHWLQSLHVIAAP